jgi:hypothetical protein
VATLFAEGDASEALALPGAPVRHDETSPRGHPATDSSFVQVHHDELAVKQIRVREPLSRDPERTHLLFCRQRGSNL